MLLANGLNSSGKSGESTKRIVCSGLTYKLPAPPTTNKRLGLPLKISVKCFKLV